MSVINLPLTKKLIALAEGKTIPQSLLEKSPIFKTMMEDGVLDFIPHGKGGSYKVRTSVDFHAYIHDILGIRDLNALYDVLMDEDSTRSDLVNVTSDSKTKRIRSFKGFLVNSYEKIECELNGKPMTVCPEEGTFSFIYDFKSFKIPENVIVVGLENPENFRHIREQKNLFDTNPETSGHPLLFVSRYPQDQHEDLIRWLLSVSNKYVHSGDLDLGGIDTYQNEYYKYLGERSVFFIPDNPEKWIRQGNDLEYDKQYHFKKPKDKRLQPLVDLIHKYHKSFHQEGFWKKEKTSSQN